MREKRLRGSSLLLLNDRLRCCLNLLLHGLRVSLRLLNRRAVSGLLRGRLGCGGRVYLVYGRKQIGKRLLVRHFGQVLLLLDEILGDNGRLGGRFFLRYFKRRLLHFPRDFAHNFARGGRGFLRGAYGLRHGFGNAYGLCRSFGSAYRLCRGFGNACGLCRCFGSAYRL